MFASVQPRPVSQQRCGIYEPAELLGFVLEALDEIDILVGYGYDEFAVGSALKGYIRLVRLPAGQEPLFPSRFRDRLAKQAPSQLDAALLWRVSIERVKELRDILVGLRASGQYPATQGLGG